MSKLTGVEIVVVYLEEQGMDTVSGYPNGTILNIYGVLYQHRGEITHTLTSHEQGASHAADGYVRVTGKASVCLTTPGPSATSLVAGTATACMDSVPVAAITCNVTNSLLGRDSSQEIDITDVTMPITKYNFIMKDVSHPATVTRRMFTIVQTGHPNPVLVDAIKDMAAALREYEKQVPEGVVHQDDTITEQDVDRVVEMIHKAVEPLTLAGGGAVLSNAPDELRVFAHKIQAPVAGNPMGKGAFDGVDELYTGMAGMHGTKTFNFSITEADLLIVVGVRPSNRMTSNASKFAENAKVLQLDIDPTEINKNTKMDTNITDDVKIISYKLNARLDPVNRDRWTTHTERMKGMYPLRYDESVLVDPLVVQATNEVTGGGAITITETGQYQMWATQYYQYHQPRTLLTSGGLGTTRYGLGAAIDAKMGCRDKTAIGIAGDGCFRMNMNRITIVTRYNIPVMEVIINNYALGMVRQWQTLFYDKRYSRIVLNDSVDFVKIVEAMGAKAYCVTQKEELEPMFHEIVSLSIPVVIGCQISCNDKVSPIVSPGAPTTGAFDGTNLKTN